MRIAHIEPFSGASGDMLLGALVDAGLSPAGLLAVLDGLGLDGWTLGAEPLIRGGLAATGVKIVVDEGEPRRRWADIRSLLAAARLPDAVRQRALATFRRLALAESRIHRVPVDDVVFHEVGGLDALIDIVGVCAGFHLLGIQRVTSAPVAHGTGTVETEHGTLPVPAPAVLALLEGAPVYGVDEQAELCTPTGAALLAEWTLAWGPLPSMRLRTAGYGAGSRDLRRPNVLRVVVGDAIAPGDIEPLTVLEATVDDMAGELTPVVLDALRTAGARDAWARQVLMKKGRPGVELVCLADAAHVDGVRAALFRQSTTLGVREYHVHRRTLEREHATVMVEGQPVRVKLGRLDGRVVNVAPEFDDCSAVAEATGTAVKTIMELARAAWHNKEPS
jgi:pyridinium-3,5-bisthiocarboxylic acid mononucleotide nickel chelatase